MDDDNTIKSVLCNGSNVPVVVPKTIMVFAPHPDDELLSCGGTLLKYRDMGSKIIVIVVTAGKGGYAKEEHKADIEDKRQHEINMVKELMDVEFLEMGFDEIETNRFFVSRFTRLIREYKPQLIFAPHYTDIHRTHRKLAEIVREAIYHTATGKAYGGEGKQYMPLGVYYYESPSCKFEYIEGNVFVTVDISKYWDKKMKIFEKAYASQKEVIGRVTRWAEKTALLRGNEISTDYGEAFIPSTEYVPLKILLI